MPLSLHFHPAEAIAHILETATGGIRRRVEAVAGGPARTQVVLVLASLLALDAADKATMSAVAGGLKHAFHINNAQIGLLIAVASFAGAVLTLPVGLLVDRMRRNRILVWATVTWSIAMACSGVAPSYLFLLVTRLCLGAITAAAFPALASLVGDFFPAADRARIYGLILSGELAGVGIGFFLGGVISSWLDWRGPFFVMAAFGACVVWALWRFLPEPARGGQSWLSPGQKRVKAAGEQRDGARPDGQEESSSGLQDKILEQGFEPRENLVLTRDPAQCGLWWAIRYVMHIPTYLCLIFASSLAYFFFGGIRGFAMIYFTAHYHVSRDTLGGFVIVIGIGAIAGMVLGGRLAEHLLQRGWFRTRVVLPGISLAICIVFFGAGVWTTRPEIGIPLLTIGAAALAAANPSIDAARLDVMHPRLWGRAESGRMAVRAIFEGGAPLLFGMMSMWLGGGTVGLEYAFLVMLIPLAVAASLAIPARRYYRRDVATAGESARRTAGEARDKG